MKHTHSRQQGQALVEFALTIPILLFVIFGTIDLAHLMFAYTQVIDAARQGVRYGIVSGLDGNNPQYLNCSGIQQTAKKLPGLVNMSNVRVNVSYEASNGGESVSCGSVTQSQLMDTNRNVLVVQVSGSVAPITPVFGIFANQFDFSYTSRRTILFEGTAYTSDWPEPPAAPQNFQATLNCTTHQVEFSWTPMSPMPDRLEIRDSLSGNAVANPNPAYAYCRTSQSPSCDAQLPTGAVSGMYYLVAFNGQQGDIDEHIPDTEMAGPSSNDAVVTTAACGGGGDTGGGNTGSTVTVSGVVFNDKNGNGRKTASEAGISGVRVTLTSYGADGTLGTADDVATTATTGSNGSFTFSNVSLSGLTYQVFRVRVSPTDAALGGKSATTSVSYDTPALSAGQTNSSAAFGFR
ncbi:MAG TPA: TadE/TadG family type IV pilus assembly protein [Aggregatilineaceae bacterium]|nr:TadE/TadG family type IV pilus assembly protein [Aggregatilineaceae bacterium]